MTTTREAAETTFATHRAYEQDGAAFALTTTPFDARVTIDPERTQNGEETTASDAPAMGSGDADENDDPTANSQKPNAESRYLVQVRVPTIDAATEEHVAEALREGWFDTFSLRLADAPRVTRSDVDVPEPDVKNVGTEVVVTVEFAHASPKRAAAVAKTLAEYVEGTYAEGVVPGYTYESPVADLLARARAQGATESDGRDGSERGESDDSEDTGTRGPMPL